MPATSIPPGEVVAGMRPSSGFANRSDVQVHQLRRDLRGRWRVAVRAVMVLLSLHGLSAAQIAVPLDCDAGTVRRWIARFNDRGVAALADRPRSGRPPLGGPLSPARIAGLLQRPGPRTVPRVWRYLGRPQVSLRTVYRHLRQIAIWRRPKLIARGDPARAGGGGGDRRPAAPVAAWHGGVGGQRDPPAPAAPGACDPDAARAPSPDRPRSHAPGKNRQITVLGALEVTTGRWAYRLGRRSAADFLALLQQVMAAFPAAPAVVVICDNDSIHHARAVREFVAAHPGVHLWFGARYSPHDNPVERHSRSASCPAVAASARYRSAARVASWAIACARSASATAPCDVSYRRPVVLSDAVTMVATWCHQL
ncbi:IS630 family transposase [Thermomonospora echinospora]|uniref:IS630 family transposase n=1 Tax=Thermomonospora echinospora TaxID=1992 RepID=UPI0011AFE332|nr:IS630 family transposase [Thermomonospora echinospora]